MSRLHRLNALSEDSLLHGVFSEGFHHQDALLLHLPAPSSLRLDADRLLAEVLAGFIQRAPAGVGRLMQLRNRLVRPWQLRTSPLGCPVSSLLSEDAPLRFAGRFPVLAARSAADGRSSQVLLGADDRHLRFRTCVDVRLDTQGAVQVGMATRVACRNRFGRLYMAAIAAVHCWYVAPVMLRAACACLDTTFDTTLDATACRSELAREGLAARTL